MSVKKNNDQYSRLCTGKRTRSSNTNSSSSCKSSIATFRKKIGKLVSCHASTSNHEIESDDESESEIYTQHEEELEDENIEEPIDPKEPHRESKVWLYFEKPAPGVNRAVCKLCSNSYATGGGTTALSNHLERKHFSQMLSKEKSVDRKSQMSLDSFLGNSLVHYYTNNNPRKKELDKKLGLFVARDFQPYSVVEDAGFRDFLEFVDPKYKLPCRQTLTNSIIPNLFNCCKFGVLEVLKDVRYLALSIDGWSSVSQDSYIGITAHFISKDWKMQKMLVDLVNVTQVSENAELIGKEVRNVCTKHNIFQKVMCIVTDEANVMICAVEKELKKKHLPCLCHAFNTVIRNSFSKQLADEKDEDANALKNLVSKCKHIVSFFHRSNKAVRISKNINAENLEEGELRKTKFVQMIETRWGTALGMLQSVIDNHDIVKKTKLEGEYDDEMLSPLTRQELQETANIIRILRPFDVATKQFSGDSYVTISSIIPIVQGIRIYLQEIEAEITAPIAQVFYRRVITQFHSKLSYYEMRSLARMATILDPRYDDRAFSSLQSYDEGKKLILNSYSKWTNTSTTTSETPSSSTNEDNTRAHGSGNSNSINLLKYLTSGSINKQSNQSDAISAFQTYKCLPKPALNSNVLEYWSRRTADLPVFADMVRGILCIPGSSVSVERLFSVTGYIVTERRNRLLPQHVYELSYIKENYQYALL